LLVRKSNTEKKKEEKPSEKDKDNDKKKDDRRLFSEEEPEKAVGSRDTTFELRDVRDGRTLWTRKFENETPFYFIDHDENRVGLSWYLSSKAAREIIAANPELSARVSKMQEKVGDRLVQFIEATTGKVNGHFLLETGKGSIDVGGLSSSGDYVLVRDSDNRVLVYSISTGDLLYRFFGDYSAISNAARMIAVENLPGRVTIYDLKTGREIERLSFARSVTRMNFLDGGKRFFVLTSDQTAFMFDAAKFSADSRLAAK